jgi:hypothetical protein
MRWLGGDINLNSSSSDSDATLPDSETSAGAEAGVEGVGGSALGLAWVLGSGIVGEVSARGAWAGTGTTEGAVVRARAA